MRKRANNTNPYTEANRFRRIDYVKITIFGFALSALWSSLHIVIMPLRLLDFVPEALKNTYLDLLILAGVIPAMAGFRSTGRCPTGGNARHCANGERTARDQSCSIFLTAHPVQKLQD